MLTNGQIDSLTYLNSTKSYCTSFISLHQITSYRLLSPTLLQTAAHRKARVLQQSPEMDNWRTFLYFPTEGQIKETSHLILCSLKEKAQMPEQFKHLWLEPLLGNPNVTFALKASAHFKHFRGAIALSGILIADSNYCHSLKSACPSLHVVLINNIVAAHIGGLSLNSSLHKCDYHCWHFRTLVCAHQNVK